MSNLQNILLFTALQVGLDATLLEVPIPSHYHADQGLLWAQSALQGQLGESSLAGFDLPLPLNQILSLWLPLHGLKT
jgi:hypothetical protein